MCYSTPSGETIHDDPAMLATRIKAIGAGLIAIDGCCGAGKTHLAKWLGTTQDIRVVEADKFLIPQTEVFVKSLRMDELRTAVIETNPKENLVILEGVCIRNVLEELAITASMFVYVLRTPEMGVPYDADILDFECECEIHKYEGREPRAPEVVLGPELAEYHRHQKPRRTADILFIRTVRSLQT
jgi:hypothetical protein